MSNEIFFQHQPHRGSSCCLRGEVKLEQGRGPEPSTGTGVRMWGLVNSVHDTKVSVTLRWLTLPWKSTLIGLCQMFRLPGPIVLDLAFQHPPFPGPLFHLVISLNVCLCFRVYCITVQTCNGYKSAYYAFSNICCKYRWSANKARIMKGHGEHLERVLQMFEGFCFIVWERTDCALGILQRC